MNKVTWYGPYNNPLEAAVKCLDGNDMDTVEFMTHRIWDGVGAYNFHDGVEDFVDDLITWIGLNIDVVVQQRDGGFWAALEAEADESTPEVKPCPCCGATSSIQVLKHSECDWLEQEDGDEGFYVICAVGSGGCGMSSGWKGDRADVIKLWNTRQ